MKEKVNISRIAKDLGISVSTVSRALSGNGRVAEATRQEILDYLLNKQLVPNVREKNYTDITTNIVAVTVPEEGNFVFMPYFQHTFFSIYDFFSIRGIQVIPIKISAQNISYLKKAVEDHVMDGVILTRRVENVEEIKYLKEHGVPFVLIGEIDDPEIVQVGADNEQATCDLVSALIQKGYYKMAVMCAEKRQPINQIRLKGLINAHVKNYMVLNQEFVFYDTDSEDIAELAVEKILAANMDAIICMDDNICLNLLKILKKRHIEIPKRIKVASLHNSPFLEAWNPSITCVNYDVDGAGKEAARMLYTLLTEKRKLPKVVMGYEVQMKESTN
ncbi:MAG: LacI family DNA-binding transcriptional regulator [Lachnospiraceae bacterium]|nr:LacI family DNA-binding transcriptional regulator [Lachnospiraceae bacterium]